MSQPRGNPALHGGLDAPRTAHRPNSRSRNPAPAIDPSLPLLPQGPEALVLPEGPVGEEAAELLHEFVHPHRHTNEDLIGDEPGLEQMTESAKLPWWKRPSPWWFLCVIPFSTMAVSASMAPRIEIYTRLACEVHLPNSTIPEGMETGTSALTSIFTNGLVYLTSENQIAKDICSSDPIVGAEAAKLNMVYMTSMGILSCLTTAGWGSLSDRWGRTRVLGVAVTGLLFTDMNFISVSKFWRSLPGGYWFFVVGALVEGCLGGMATASAGIHAYIADCTDANTRSRFFSLFLGLLFCGMALGPTLGGLLIKYTGNLLLPFYFAAFMHFIYAIAIWNFVPESLTEKQMAEARSKHTAKIEQQRALDIDSRRSILLRRADTLFTSLSPLKLFLSPPFKKGQNPMNPKRDWNLSFIALSYGGVIMLMGSSNYVFQYTSNVWGWTSEQIGYWLSIVGLTRALFLTVFIPVIIKLFKPNPPPIQLPVEPTEPLRPDPTQPAETINKKSTTAYHHGSIAFDLGLAKFALIVDMTAYLLLPLALNPIMFTVYTIVGCLGTGFSPAVQSVAMGLYTHQGGTELGKLFGALSVMSALCSQILGPALFGLTYMKTVGFMPSAIFYLGFSAVAFSFICLSFVRLPRGEEELGDEEQQSLAGSQVELSQED